MNFPEKKKSIQKKLLKWYQKNKRDLPWRRTADPYAIWVSEIMLQQTQVSTVLPYYQKFLKVFPTVSRLARADLPKVLKTWEGLGYYSRARNLHRASRIVIEHYRDRLPNTQDNLIRLPGIGRSTAGAILSFAFNKDAAILEANAKRVLSRLFAVSSNSKKENTEKTLWSIAKSLIPKGLSNPFNQALMDLGSMICTPKDPLCPECPLHRYCKGRRSGRPERFSQRIPRKKIPHIEGVCAVIWKKGKVLLNQRPPSGLLGGLWEFPNWRTEEKEKPRLGLRNYVKKETRMDVEVTGSLGTFKHTFSHFKLTLYVYHCQLIDGMGKGKWVLLKNLPLLPMSRIHRRIANLISDRKLQISD